MAEITVSYGNEIVKNTYEALQASDIGQYLKKEFSVSIKPNLVLSRPAKEGATTHTQVVEGIIRFLKDYGISKINIIEGSWVGDSTKRAFQICGYEALSRTYQVPLIDLKQAATTFIPYGEYKLEVCKAALDTDFLINVPVLKAHCQTLFTCCMKNLKGCIPDSEKRKYHSHGIHKPVAALNAVLKTGYCVVDGICGDLSFEEGGNPVESNRIIAGANPLLVDSYCAELIGYRPDEIGYLVYGKKFGVGDFFTDKTEILELHVENKPVNSMKSSNAVKRYKQYIEEDSACSACYSSLVYALHRLDTKALGALPGTVKIGQGYKGRSGAGIGVGNCTGGFAQCIKGCPPKAVDIVKYLST